MSTQITSSNIALGSITADLISVDGVSTATNIDGGTANQIPYQSGPGYQAGSEGHAIQQVNIFVK